MTILGIPIELYAAYVLACTAVVIVPGPSVTVIVANSLRHGVKAGLLNVAGTQAGLAIMLLILATGLQFIVESLAQVFDIIRWAGAAYLIWLGVKLLRSDGNMGNVSEVPRANGSFFWQGFLVVLSNPKALFFFGALIPQFLTTGGNALAQTLLLGATFIAVATPLDSSYAFLAGGAGKWLSRTRVRALEVGSGLCLIGGGIWLALARR
ncbi:MAG: LysE family translocator [Pseudomonadota bacterium]